MKSNQIFSVLAVVVVIGGLFYLSAYLSPNKKIIAAWKSAGIECLPNGHSNLLQHIHQHLEVVVDGVSVPIPEGIGVLNNCLAEVHTHAGEGALIHVETVTPDKKHTLQDFFTVWGVPYERPGFTRTMVVNTATSTDNTPIVLTDTADIKVIYQTASPAGTTN